ncbi:MAG: leucine-rich repeat protein [Eubacterium sp.]|nr:leucine-rich repeat protein [Eubacterium sp.]
MKKKLLILFSLIISCGMISFPVLAAEDGGETETIYPMGVIPSDMVVGDPVNQPVRRAVRGTSGSVDLPGSLDGRTLGYVTSVKNQGKYGACWAFATNAALESNMLKKGLADPGINLSELHMIYFMYNYNIDPMGRIMDDRNYISADTHGTPLNDFKVMADIGGKVDCTGWQMTNGVIPLQEAGEDYDASCADSSFTIDQAECFASDYVVRKMYICNFKYENIQNVKNLVYRFGGAAVDFYCEQTTGCFGQSNYFNVIDGTKTYYNPNGISKKTTHGVEIVGWDDDYPKEKFKVQPPGDGAWLIKNSWGYSDENDGYIWISYYDECTNAKAVAYDVEKKETNEVLYQYDGSDHFGYYPCPYKYYLAMYSADESDEGMTEVIKRVGVGSDADASFVISVLLNPVIEDGQLVSYEEKAVTSCTSPYAGYDVFDLSEEVTVNHGDTFAIMVTADPDTIIYAAGDSTPKKPGMVGCTESVEEGQYYASNYTYALITPTGSPCIRAYSIAGRDPNATPRPTPTLRPTPTPKPTATPTVTPAVTPNVTATPEENVTPTVSPSSTPTKCGCPTSLPTAIPIIPSTEPTENSSTRAKIGSKWVTSIGIYKVTGETTVAYVAPNNKKAKSVVIPSMVAINGEIYYVTEIGSKAFYKCKNLKKVTIKSSKIKKIGSKAFKGIYKKAKFYLPKKKFSKYKKKLKKAGAPKKAKYKKN